MNTARPGSKQKHKANWKSGELLRTFDSLARPQCVGVSGLPCVIARAACRRSQVSASFGQASRDHHSCRHNIWGQEIDGEQPHPVGLYEVKHGQTNLDDRSWG